MENIFNEMIIVKKYRFIDDVWEVIKDYMGINGGIKINTAFTLYNLGIPKLENIALFVFNIYDEFKRGNAADKRKKILNEIYKKYRLINKCNKMAICDKIDYLLDSVKFKTPEDLQIGETILLYKDTFFEETRKVGKVHSISKYQFIVYIEKTKEYKIVKTDKFKRRNEAISQNMINLYNI
jgi:hypothetical protein